MLSAKWLTSVLHISDNKLVPTDLLLVCDYTGFTCSLLTSVLRISDKKPKAIPFDFYISLTHRLLSYGSASLTCSRQSGLLVYCIYPTINLLLHIFCLHVTLIVLLVLSLPVYCIYPTMPLFLLIFLLLYHGFGTMAATTFYMIILV